MPVLIILKELKMDKQIQDYQDKMVGYLIKAQELQNESGFEIMINNKEIGIVSVNEVLRSLFKMTTREDLKEKIKKALDE